MGIEKGAAFLLKVGDGGAVPVFATVAGLRTTQLSINGETVVVTNKDWCVITAPRCGGSRGPSPTA